MPPDRAAGRFAASSSARAGRRSEKLPRRYRGYGNSAAARRPPGGEPKSVRHQSRQYRSWLPAPRREVADGTDLVGAAGIGRAEIAGDAERLVEVLAVDEIEAEQLFLGFGIGAVQHQRRI